MDAEARLAAFVAPYAPAVTTLAMAAVDRLRVRLPHANLLVYNNATVLAIAFAFGDRQADVICSIALYPRWATLFFFDKGALVDPHGLLAGGGRMGSYRLQGPDDLDRPEILDLVGQSIARARERGVVPGPDPGQVVIRQDSANARPRRPKAR